MQNYTPPLLPPPPRRLAAGSAAGALIGLADPRSAIPSTVTERRRREVKARGARRLGSSSRRGSDPYLLWRARPRRPVPSASSGWQEDFPQADPDSIARYDDALPASARPADLRRLSKGTGPSTSTGRRAIADVILMNIKAKAETEECGLRPTGLAASRHPDRLTSTSARTRSRKPRRACAIMGALTGKMDEAEAFNRAARRARSPRSNRRDRRQPDSEARAFFNRPRSCSFPTIALS